MEKNWEKLYEKWGEKKKTRRKRKLILIPVLLILIGIGISFYFFVLPGLTKKPFIPKPSYEGNVTTEHVNWIVNELGAYRLHASPLEEKPEIEINIFDIDEFFTVIIENNIPKTYPGRAENPDIRIITKTVYIEELLEADDLVNKVVSSYKKGKIKVEILKADEILISKGYKVLYDEFKPLL